jgi:hypothetical protein
VAATGLGLLDYRDRDLAELLHRLGVIAQQLQQAVGAGEPSSAAADDRDADLDPLVLGVEATLDELPGRVNRGREICRDNLAVGACHLAHHSH